MRFGPPEWSNPIVRYAQLVNERAHGAPLMPEPDAPEPDMPEHAAVTGVARGSLGTGTVLEDTQEWVVPDELRASPADEGAMAPAPVPAAAPAPTAPTVRRRVRSGPIGGFAATPRAAGLAAVVLLALVGVAAIVTSQDQRIPDAGTVPAQDATAAPTDAPPADAAGGGGKGENGMGPKDKDKGGNGKGND